MRSCSLQRHAAPLLLAGLAFCLVVARARLQSITIDEAASYVHFAGPSWPDQWFPSSQNHVLNSILERVVTYVFGLDELTVRLPALAGAAIYIVSALFICMRLTDRRLLQAASFVCLVYNPMVLDYLVAARGYSLAVGFLLAAIAVMTTAILACGSTADRRRSCAWASVCLGLSMCANFSFAIADGTAMLFFFLWAVLPRKGVTAASLAQTAAASFLPGIATVFIICGWTVWHFSKREFFFGSTSVTETWHGLVAGSYDNLNPEMLNPWLVTWLGKAQPVMPAVGAAAFVILLAAIERDRWLARDSAPPPRLTLVRLLVCIGAVTLLLHWAAFRTLHLLMPKDRTALFFVPFLTVAFSAALAQRYQSGARDVLRPVGMAIVILIAFYFAGCLRLSYFKAWPFNADSRQVYQVLEDLQRRCGTRQYLADWRFRATLEFYRLSHQNQTLSEFAAASAGYGDMDENRALVFCSPNQMELAEHRGLQIVYRDFRSCATIAIRACKPTAGPS
jgi:hypothetical protein